VPQIKGAISVNKHQIGHKQILYLSITFDLPCQSLISHFSGNKANLNSDWMNYSVPDQIKQLVHVTIAVSLLPNDNV